MSSIAEQFIRISRAKAAIRMALQAKGVDVPEDTPLEDYPQKIAEITAPERYLLKSGQNFRGHSFRIPPLVDTSHCESLAWLYSECTLLERVAPIDTSICSIFQSMYSQCINLISTPQIDTGKGIDFIRMYEECRNLVFIHDMDTGKAMMMDQVFNRCMRLRVLPVTDVSNVTSARYFANECYNLEEVRPLVFAKAHDLTRCFAYCQSLRSIDIDTRVARVIDSILVGCKSLAGEIRIDCANAFNANSAFADCESLEVIDINTSPNLQHANTMFHQCRKLVTIKGSLILDTNNTHAILSGCSSLVNVRIERLKTSIYLHESPNLSVESVLHLFTHAQEVTGKTIHLHRRLEDKLEDEQIEIAVLKGWQVLFHG